MQESTQITTPSFEDQLIPERSPMAELWHLLKMNRLAFAGLLIFVVFFCVAFTGLILTSGSNPVFDPAMVRLQEKLRPPLSTPQYDLLISGQIPPLGVYLLGTDDLGRDIFARMLQGAWVSLTVGFVAVGISVIIGILFGGIAGYCGHYHLRIDIYFP
jgi:peptide/nickel transport system permease protein